MNCITYIYIYTYTHAENSRTVDDRKDHQGTFELFTLYMDPMIDVVESITC